MWNDPDKILDFAWDIQAFLNGYTDLYRPYDINESGFKLVEAGDNYVKIELWVAKVPVEIDEEVDDNGSKSAKSS